MDFGLQQQKTISQKPTHDISCLQSERGGEFTSGPEDVGKKRSLFDKICKRLNITRRLTSAKSPNQNGRELFWGPGDFTSPQPEKEKRSKDDLAIYMT